MRYLIVFLFLAAGALLLLGVNPFILVGRWFLFHYWDEEPLAKRLSLKQLREELLGLKKLSTAKRLESEVGRALAYEGRTNALWGIKRVSFCGSAAGVAIAAAMRNVFLMPVLAAAGWFIPMWLVKGRNSKYQARIAVDLEAGLSVITSSYLRKSDIVLAVEENMSYLPASIAAPFRAFLVNTRMVSADVPAALYQLRRSFPQDVFQNWCDVMIQCQENTLMQALLQPTLQSFADLREIQAEFDTQVAFVRKDTITLCVGVLVALLIFCSVSDWFQILYTTIPGKGVLAGVVLAILFAINKAIEMTEPLSFKGAQKK